MLFVTRKQSQLHETLAQPLSGSPRQTSALVQPRLVVQRQEDKSQSACSPRTRPDKYPDKAPSRIPRLAGKSPGKSPSVCAPRGHGLPHALGSFLLLPTIYLYRCH